MGEVAILQRPAKSGVKTYWSEQRGFPWSAETSGSETASREAARRVSKRSNLFRSVLPKEMGVV